MDFTTPIPRRPLGSSSSSSSTTVSSNRYGSRTVSSSSTPNRTTPSNSNRIPNRNKGILLIFITLTLFGLVFWYGFFHRSSSLPFLNTLFQDLDKSFNNQGSSSPRMVTLQSQYGAAHMQNMLTQSNTNTNILRGTSLHPSTDETVKQQEKKDNHHPILQQGMDEHVQKSVELAKRMEELDRLKREQAILEEQIRKEALLSSSPNSRDTISTTTTTTTEDEGSSTESWISRHRRMKQERRQQRQRQRREQALLEKGTEAEERTEENDGQHRSPVLPNSETTNPSEQPNQQLLSQQQPPSSQQGSSSPSSLDPSIPCVQYSHVPSKHPLLFTERYVKDKVLPKEKCENFFGNTWLRSFADSRREVCVPGNSNTGSRIWRYDAATGARFSWMKNVKIDFGQMRTVGDNRQFSGGFVQVACDETSPGAVSHIADGRAEPGLSGFQRLDGNANLECDEWEHSPTVIIQHDDIGNMYHNLADHFRTWLALALIQQPVCEKKTKVLQSKTPVDSKRANMCPAPDEISTYYPSVVGLTNPEQEVSKLKCAEDETVVYGVDPDNALLINMDGRVMCNVVNPDGTPVSGPREDCEGPYFPQYRKWFGKGVNKAREYGNKKVCFSSLAWAVNSPESHPWAYFGEPSECDGTSPLWMQYTTYVLNRWNLLDLKPLVKRPDCTNGNCKPYVRILYVVRKKKPFNPQPVRDRVIANEGEFISMLQTAVPDIDIEVDAADFTGMSFEEQLRHVRRSHLMIGMHGAGMVHAIHLSQTDTCNGPTGVIELLPAGHGEWGIGHLTSYEGHRYWRWASTDTSRETGMGTNVDLGTVKSMVEQAIHYNVKGRRSDCSE